MMRVNFKVLKHQLDFVTDFETKYLALVAGFGAGKTKSLILKTIALASKNVGTDGALYSPTHTLANDTLIPEMDDQLEELGIPYKFRASPLPSYTLFFPNGSTRVLVRSFENWRRIRANNLSFACVDEIDVVDPKISRPAFKLLMGRIRVGKVRQVAVVSTPEGFGLLWEFFVKDAKGKSDRRIIQAKTTDNPFLPEDFIESLLENYPPELIRAYLDGQFVNLTQGTIYSAFDRNLNNCDDVADMEQLYIGMDFNVGKMAAIVHVLRLGEPRAVDEFFDQADTPDMINAIKERYPDQASQGLITIYPDASGQNRSTKNASESDIKLLKLAGFNVIVDSRNPSVRDRINAMNTAFCNAKGVRKYKVNIDKCPEYAQCLEQQVWRDGVPDKTQGFDHLCFAGDTMVMTPEGKVPIAELPENGEVLTIGGYTVPYFNAGLKAESASVVRVGFSNGSSVVCTPDHQFLTDMGWMKAGRLLGRLLPTIDHTVTDNQEDLASTWLYRFIEDRFFPSSDDEDWNSSRDAIAMLIAENKPLAQRFQLREPITVTSVRVAPSQDVYCLTVPVWGCFLLDGGILAANCDAGGYFIVKQMPIGENLEEAFASIGSVRPRRR